MAYVHRPETKGELIGLKLRYLKCLDTVGHREDGTPIVDLVEITVTDGIWIAFTADRKRMFFVSEKGSALPVTVKDGALAGGQGVTIKRKRISTPRHMKKGTA